ncbi:MAG TPA: ABC transporter ATP-binding protein, partial [Candidatus Microbacterium stercoravium]|nr:ABC transporter ATP-binding protein [Candidatus Microbacterium stercoravium]
MSDDAVMLDEDQAAQEAMIAAGANEPGAMGGKPKDFWPSFRRFLGLLAPHKWAFILASVLGAIGVVLAVAGPKVLGEATNVVFEGVLSATMGASFAGMSQDQVVDALEQAGQQEFANMIGAMQNFAPGEGVDFERLRVVVLWAVAIYVLSSILQWLQGYIVNVIMVRTMWRVREDIEHKVNNLPLSYFDKVQRGELISRVTNDVDNMTQTLQQSLSGAITSLLTVIGVLVMMFSISWKLALVALIALPLIGVIMGVIGPKSQKAFQSQWKKVGRLNSRVEESFSGHALVKVY